MPITPRWLCGFLGFSEKSALKVSYFNFFYIWEVQTLPNYDFICPLCREHDLVPSEITLQANYGSIYDGERVIIQLCGECFDVIFGTIIENYCGDGERDR